MSTDPPADRVTAIYDAIDAFQRTHRLPGLQHAQIRGLLAEHLTRTLPAVPVTAPPTGQTELRDRIAEALMRWAEGNNDPKYAPMRRSETVRANAYSRADAVLSVLPVPVDRGAVLREAAETPGPETQGDAGRDPSCPAARLPFGRIPADPCVMKGKHWEHATAEGHRWIETDDEDPFGVKGPRTKTEAPSEIIHACPPDGSGLTPCCGRTPFELPLGDRISSEAPVTCTTAPAAVAEPGKDPS